MADGYLEKRYEEVFGKGAKKTVVKHTSLESLMEKNRSYRGYDQNEHENRLGEKPTGASLQAGDQGNGSRKHHAKHETGRAFTRTAPPLPWH